MFGSHDYYSYDKKKVYKLKTNVFIWTYQETWVAGQIATLKSERLGHLEKHSQDLLNQPRTEFTGTITW